MKTKLLKNYIFNFISQILTLIVPLITTPYISRVLHEVGVGQYSYSSSIITYFTLFANLGFNVYGQREIAKVRNDKNKLSKVFYEVFCLRIITTLISVIVLYAILFTSGFGASYNTLILILSIQVFAVIFDLSYLYQGIEDFKSIAIRSVFVRIVMLVCIFVFVKKETDLEKYVLFVSLSQLLGMLIMWPKLFSIVTKVNIKSFELKKHIFPTILIFLPTLAVTIYSVFDKTMIGLLAKNPDYENGCYEQAYKVNSVALLLITVISPIFVPRNAAELSDGNYEQIRKNMYFVSNYTWMIGLPLIAGFIVLSNNLSSWFLGEGFDSAPLLMSIMSVRFISSGFSELFGNQYFIVVGKEKYITFSAIIAAIINVTLNYILIPYYGAVGAAIATAVCEISITIIQAMFMYKERIVSIKKMIFMSWKYIIASLIMFIPIFFMQKNLGYSIWTFILIAGVGAIIYFIVLLLLRDKFIFTLINFALSFLKRKDSKVTLNTNNVNNNEISNKENDINE